MKLRHKKLEAKKEKILNELVQGLNEKLVPKVKESISILLSGDLGTDEYTKAQTIISRAFSRAPANLKVEWDTLLNDYINNRDAMKNILGTCNL